jgi:hypothetical protein
LSPNPARSSEPSPSTASDERVTEWLVSECRDLGTRIAELNTSGERLAGPTIALLALAASVAISGGRAYLLMGLPFVLSVIITYLQYLYSDLMAMGGYKRALEEEIERRTGFPVIQWESHVVPSRFSRPQVIGTNLMISLALAASAAVALNEARATTQPGHWGNNHSVWYILLTAVSIVVGFGIILICSRAARRARVRTTAMVRASFASVASQERCKRLGTQARD